MRRSLPSGSIAPPGTPARLVLLLLATAACATLLSAAEGTARVSGSVATEGGDALGDVILIFHPVAGAPAAAASSAGASAAQGVAGSVATAPTAGDAEPMRGQRVETEVNKKGKFTVGNFPIGTYEIELRHDELAIRSMRYVGRAPDGRKVGDFAGDADVRSGRSPRFTLVTGLRATLELVVGEKPKALPTTAEVAAAREASPVLVELNNLFQLQQWADLESRSAAVAAESPDLGGAHYLLAVARWRNGKPDEAVAPMRKALELVPEQPGIRGTLGSLLLEHGTRLAEAGQQEQARAVWLEGAEHLARQLEATPGNVGYLTNRVIALDRAKQTDECLAALDQLIAADPGQVRAYLHKAELLTDLGKPDAAMAVIDQIPEGGKGAAAAVYNAAVELYNSDKMEATVAAVDKAIKMDSTMPLFFQLKGRALIKMGRDKEGIAVLKEYLAMVPEDDPEAETDRALVEALGGGG